MTDALGIAAFHDAAKTYDAWFDTQLGHYVDRLEREAFERLLKGLVKGSVVEVGAGTGHVSRWLDELGHSVTAVEPCAAMRAFGVAHVQGTQIHWSDARAERLPFPSGSFDGAVFFTTLEFVDDPARSLEEALRVLRPNGWLAIGCLHALSPWVAMYRRYGEQGRLPWASARYFVRDDLERMVGRTAERVGSAVHLAPGASAPLDDANTAGKRAGNAPAIELLLWRNT